MSGRFMSPSQSSMSGAPRRRSIAVDVGGVRVGGDAPIVVQSMTNTDTADVMATAKQTAELARAGSELVRITVNTPEAAKRDKPYRARFSDESPRPNAISILPPALLICLNYLKVFARLGLP